MQIISGNYFCQYNDGDEDNTCGDGVDTGITCVGMGMLLARFWTHDFFGGEPTDFWTCIIKCKKFQSRGKISQRSVYGARRPCVEKISIYKQRSSGTVKKWIYNYDYTPQMHSTQIQKSAT